MKNLLLIIIVTITLANCKARKADISKQSINNEKVTQDTIRIANNELEYEIIIFEVGFNAWMARRARPKSFYTQTFLEARNIPYVVEWNRRATTSGFNHSLYDMQINYSQGVDYGFDVNYILYHYFVFFEEKYNQKLTTHNPRF